MYKVQQMKTGCQYRTNSLKSKTSPLFFSLVLSAPSFFSPILVHGCKRHTIFFGFIFSFFFQLLLYIFHRACSPSFQGPSLQYASSRPHEVPLNKNLDIFILHLLLQTVILSLSFWHKYKALKSKGNCYITSESYSANSSHIKLYIFFPWGESHVLHIKLVLY